MNSMPSISETRALVFLKFDGINDSQGAPMAQHMQRVAMSVPPDEITVTIAWLHDLVEDTDVTLQDLTDTGYPPEVTDAVALLTHDKKTHSYPEYIDRLIASGNQRAIQVKIADQQDNTNPSRWLGMNPHMARSLTKKWHGVLPRLLQAVTYDA